MTKRDRRLRRRVPNGVGARRRLSRYTTVARVTAGIVIVCGALLALPAVANASSNVNFVGTWIPDTGVAWTITSENTSTGACVGTSALANAGYGLINCEVTGDKYAFTITDGPSYQSKNTGVITGNSLEGSYLDSGGSSEAYTATRQAPPSTTTVGCAEQDSPRGTFRCMAKVVTSASPPTAPTGSVTFLVTAGALNALTCDLQKIAGSDSSAECSVVDTPTLASNVAAQDVTASYAGDANAGPSTGQNTIAAVGITGSAKTVDTYLEGSDEATFTIKLSRISNTPVSFDFATADGAGASGAVAAKGEYRATKGAIAVMSGHTSATVNVLCYANVDVRAPAQFDLVLSNATGAAFSTDATDSLRSPRSLGRDPSVASPRRTRLTASGTRVDHVDHAHADVTGSVSVPETIKPDLRVGAVGAIKDLTTGQAGRIFVRRFNSLRLTQLHEGDAIYVGDELLVDPNTASDVQFVLGGATALQPGVIVRVQDERHTVVESGGDTVLSQTINLFINISHQKETIQIQTNGGVIGVKG